MKSYSVISLLLVLTFAASAWANERVLPEPVLLKMGYRPYNEFRHYRGSRRVESDLPKDLPWPVTFFDVAHTIAQNYVNFQDYGTGAYYHKGCDLRAQPDSWVKAPVTGVLEGGYYSYSENPDGSEKKFWKPWNGRVHQDPYFELALVTQDGYRFELHHVNSMNLPQTTIDALNKGRVVIQAGTAIGHVYRWNSEYHHVHYNIFRQDGMILNPEAHSLAPPDHIAPAIKGVYGVRPDGSVVEIASGKSVSAPLSEIVVATTETRDNSVYVQTPPFAGIVFKSGFSFAWDFRQFLVGPDQKWPDIRQVFLPELKAPSGARLRTWGQYGEGLFLMRLKVPANAAGPFLIQVADTAGNVSSIQGTIQ